MADRTADGIVDGIVDVINDAHPLLNCNNLPELCSIFTRAMAQLSLSYRPAMARLWPSDCRIDRSLPRSSRRHLTAMVSDRLA
jgi:hypothetical protein